MEKLKRLREQGEAMNELDRALLPKLSISQSIESFGLLYESVRPMLAATDKLYRPERAKYLVNLQRRLQRIAKWEKRREKTLYKRRKTPKAPR